MKKFWRTAMGRHLLSKEKKFLVAMTIVAFIIVAMPVRADTNIDNCTKLNVSGETYKLTADIIDSPVLTYCMDMYKNTTLDCQGHIINSSIGLNDTYYTTGVFINPDVAVEPFSDYSYNIIKNCIFQNWNDAIDSYEDDYETKNITIENNTFLNNVADGGYLNINYTVVRNNTFIGDALYIDDGYKMEIYNNTFSDDVVNTIVDNAQENHFFNNLFNITEPITATLDLWNTTRQNGTRIYSAGTEIGGNYWTNSTANGYSDTCTDLLQDGFCDDPYDVETGAACAAVADGLPACGNNTDWLPLSPLYEREQGEPTPSPRPIPNATFNITSNCCPISAFFCEGNTTLVQMWNTSQGYSYAYVACPNGCDNVTDSCAPLPYQQSLWIILVIVIIAVIIILIAWRLLR